MQYKPDWEQARERLLAWWDGKVIDRCCMAVHAPRETSDMPPFPDLQHGPWLGGLEEIPDGDQQAIINWWVDPELNYERAITWFENTYFGGEALPITYVNWGAMALAGMYGSPPSFKKTSVWYPPVIDDWNTWEWDTAPEKSEVWEKILRIVDFFAEHAENRYFVGSPELGNGADVLALLRGTEKLALDLIENPEEVRKAVDVISDTWVALMEQTYQLTTDLNANGDVLAWMGLWAPGRMDQIACDFSSIISPSMFEEFFIPEILKMGNWCDYGVYHLDGPACMRNMLDALLGVHQIDAIQFTPGTGGMATYTEEYVPRYRRILESGKNLYLLVEPHEVQKILAELPPEGLYMRTYVGSEDEAKMMLKKAKKWSARGNQYVRP